MKTKLIISLLFIGTHFIIAQPIIHNNLIDSIIEFSSLPAGEQPVRLIHNGTKFYYNSYAGKIYEVDASGNYFTKYNSSNHGLDEILGMDYESNKIYVSGSKYLIGDSTWIGYIKSVDLTTDAWTTLIQTDTLYKGNSFQDHRLGTVTIHNNNIYAHLASRTNSGELQEVAGVTNTNNLREHWCTAAIFKFPIDPSTIITIENDSTWMATSPYVFSIGLRHAFAMDFDDNGDLYAALNSDRRDIPEPIYKIQQGSNAGFPYQIGAVPNPRSSTYDPSLDTLLLDPPANNQGYYNNDPTFPPAPGGTYIVPLINVGPDADKFRNTHTGMIWDASSLGISLAGLSGHKSPTSLSFDRNDELPDSLSGTALITCWASTNSTFMYDIGSDLLSMSLKTNDTIGITRLASNFINPMAVKIIGDVAYVMDKTKIWKIIFKNCSSQQTVYIDQDNDGYGDSSSSMTIGICESIPNNYSTNNEDCDDTNPNDMSLTLDQNPIPSGIYEVNISILSSGTVSNNSAMVTFQAGETIQLLPGFTAESNSDFLGKIISAPCNSSNLNSQHQNAVSKNQKLNKKESDFQLIPQLSIFPNPSSSETNISYTLKEDSRVTINIFNINGKLVKRLISNQFKNQGIHQILFQTQALPDGIYSVILQTEKHNLNQKLLVLKKI